MRRGVLAITMIGAILLLFLLFANPSTDAPAPASTGADTVAAGGIALTSAAIEEPADEMQFTGPHADLLSARCTACHSASMPLRQPRLDLATWEKEVVKMRDVYGADVPPGEVATIAGALVDLQAATPDA